MINEKDTKGNRRRSQIFEAMKREGEISIDEIMRRFGCSEATARRDLNMLAETGKIIRTLGGAYFERASSLEVPFQDKKSVLLSEKLAIAAKAVSLIEEGDVIGLTGGSTTFLIAKEIKHLNNITVVTNAVNIAMELAESDTVQTVLTGGVLRGKSYELCGPLAEGVLAKLNIGKMFAGIDGINLEQGLMTYSELEAHIGRLMIERSKQAVAVFDHTKVNRTSLFTMAPLSSVQACITDKKLEPAWESHLQALRIEMHYT
ncbi:DeoR/GlpR family DNA-binding transcription regulator [Paenibacillus alkalitolerans]|uniref:DeoR/GlpR family DNA-binding transcription regulator n=1 Tax=Paenibacillus alkalitolerans TaxID=2799335 RepID=UPI002D7ED39A|nr:DeoR/GlpR family DNA-binding transcription regulator [Paenibacillus alkalitolerans]